jgi:hypothetical protein
MAVKESGAAANKVIQGKIYGHEYRYPLDSSCGLSDIVSHRTFID